MKKLLLLLFSLMLSFNSYGEWTKLWESEEGEAVFIGFDRLILKDEYVYSWFMTSNNKTSQQIYLQSDCDLIRIKPIQANRYDQPLGDGEGTTLKEEPWQYLAPESGGELIVEMLCSLAKETPEERKKTIEEITGLTKESLTKTPLNAYGSGDSWKCNSGYIRHNNGCKPEIIDYELTARSLIIEDQLNTLKNAYINNIAARVRTFWRYQGADDGWTAEVYVVQDRDGNVNAVDVRNANVSDSSLAKSFMDSIERAVYKSSPLPAAPDEAVFDKELYFIFSVN
jgi:hypothetical protein